jgi:hypothetical protein
VALPESALADPAVAMASGTAITTAAVILRRMLIPPPVDERCFDLSS